MNMIEVVLTDEQYEFCKEHAAFMGVTIEEYIRILIQEEMAGGR